MFVRIIYFRQHDPYNKQTNRLGPSRQKDRQAKSEHKLTSKYTMQNIQMYLTILLLQIFLLKCKFNSVVRSKSISTRHVQIGLSIQRIRI